MKKGLVTGAVVGALLPLGAYAQTVEPDPAPLGDYTETTVAAKSSSETWSGMLRRVEPSRTVFIVNGKEYTLSGPMMFELATQSGKKVKLTGRLNAPAKTIEIESYELEG